MAARPKSPNVDSVTTINPDGSHYFLHPSDARGRFTLWRRVFAVVLLAVYILLPWIQINGHPAVFLDTANRKFHLFGLTFLAQDLWLGFFFITGAGFSLFYITSLFGRLWCGWACPYTIFLEHVFRRIERIIEGDGPKRRQLDKAPWTIGKICRRVLKHALYLLAAAAITHIFLSYFVSLPKLWNWMQGNPQEHWLAFSIILFLTGVLYFCFAWFREQFCIMLCPYGRIQSALTDDNTLVVGYDEKRGEPRGKAGTEGAGDCVNCIKCVQVCPTGIDIRDGLQLECIGCAACIDACDDVMDRLQRKRGLIRYDSFNGLKGEKTQWMRPRIIVYTVVMLAGALGLLIALHTVKPLSTNLTRMAGLPYFVNATGVRNNFQIYVTNKQQEPRTITLTLEGAPPGTQLIGPQPNTKLGPLEEQKLVAIVDVPRAAYKGPQAMKIRIASEPGGVVAELPFQFSGPDAKALENAK